MLERENTVDVSFDSGISLVDRPPDDVKKEILEYQRILFILDRDRDKHAQTRNRLSQFSDRKPKQKKTDVCNVCCETIDLEDFKCCVTCCNCGKDVCRGRQCSTWLPRQAEWECHLCNLSNESRSRTNEWIHRQVLPNLNPRPMSMRSDTTIPVRGNNGSHLPYNYETHSEAASFCPEEKEKVRGYVEDILAGMLGGSLDDVSVGQLYRSREYLPLSGSENNYGGVSHVKLKRLIERIIEDTLHLPALIDYSGVPGRPEESLPYFDPKRYQELLATAVLNKIVDSYNYEKKFSSNPEIQTSADLDNNHNTVITRKDQRTYSSSSSIEPRSDSSLADANNINRQQDVSPSESYSNLLSEAIKQNPQQEDESLLSDYIAKHRVPLPDFTLEFEQDSVSDDLVSIATSHGGQEGSWENNWLFKRKKPGSDNPAPIGMLVPAPKEDVRALIGDRTTDEVSDLSEAGSDLEDDINDVNSDESQNGRVQNKHLIGGKSTVGIFDELLEQTSLVSTSSLPENEPAYTETKNDFVLGNDGLHDVQSLKLNLISGNISVQNEAVNSELTTQILEVQQPSKHAQSDRPGNIIEETLILPPPPCFIDSEEGACKLEGMVDDNLNGGPLSNDSNAVQSQLINELNSATNNTNTEIADIKKVSENETSEITINENKSFLRESRETLVTRRASAIEFLAVFALSPVLAFSTSEIDNRIIMKPTVRNLIEESDNDDEKENLITYSIGAEPSTHTGEVSNVCAEETVSETCTSIDSASVVEEAKDSEKISEQGSATEIKESKIEDTEFNSSDSLKLEGTSQFKEEIVTLVQAESTEKITVEETLEDNTQNLEEVNNMCAKYESVTQKDNKSSDIKAPQEPEVEHEIPISNSENVTELVKCCTESAISSEDNATVPNATVPNESCDINQNEKTSESQVPVVAEEIELVENIETVELKKEEICEEIPSTRAVPTELTLELDSVPVTSSILSNTDEASNVETMSEDTANLEILAKKQESQKLQEKTSEIATNISPIVAEAEFAESDTRADKTEVEQVPETTEIIILPQDPIISKAVEGTSVETRKINLKENTELIEVHQTTENLLPIEESLESDKTVTGSLKVEFQSLKSSADLLPTKAPQTSETAVLPAALITQDLDETVQIKPLEELKLTEESPVSMDASVLQIGLNQVVENPGVPKEEGHATINLTEKELSKKDEPTGSEISATVVIDAVLESQQSQSEPEISKTCEVSLTNEELATKENLTISGKEAQAEISKENEASNILINQTEQNIPKKSEELSSDINITKNSVKSHISKANNIEAANITSTENTQSDPAEYEDKICENIEKSESRTISQLKNSEDVISSTKLEVTSLKKDDVVGNSPDTFVEVPAEASQVEEFDEKSTTCKDNGSKTEEQDSQNIIVESIVDENDQNSAHTEENKELNCKEPTAIMIDEISVEHDDSIDAVNSGETEKLSDTKETVYEKANETHTVIDETSIVEEEFIASPEIENLTEDICSIPKVYHEIDSPQLKEEQAEKVQALTSEVKELTSEVTTDEHKIAESAIYSETTALDTAISCNKKAASERAIKEENEIESKSKPAEPTETQRQVEVTTESISPASSNFSLIIDSVKAVDIRKYSISEQDIKSDVLSELPKKELAANIEDISEAVADDENRRVSEITQLVEVTEKLFDGELESKDAKCKEDTSKLAESLELTSETSESSKLEEATNEKSFIEESKDSQYNTNITTTEENKITEIDACSSLKSQAAQSEQKEVGSHIEGVIQTKDLQSEPVNNGQTSYEESATKIHKCSEVNLIDDASLPENKAKTPDPVITNTQDVEKQEEDTATQTSQRIIEEILETNIDSNSVQEHLPNAALPSVGEQAPIVAQCEETAAINTEEPTITEKQNLQTIQSKDVILTPPLEFQCDTKESLAPSDTNLVVNNGSTSNDEPITDQNAEDLNTEANDKNLKTEGITEACNLKIEDSSENEDHKIETEENIEEQKEDTVSFSEKQVELLPSNVILTEFQQTEQCQTREDYNIKEEELPSSEPAVSSSVSIENNKNNKNSVSEIKESDTTLDMNNPKSSDESSATNIIDESKFVATETYNLDEFSVEVKKEAAVSYLGSENIILKEIVNEENGKDSIVSEIIDDASLNENGQVNMIESQEVLQEAEDANCALDQNVEAVTTTNSDAASPTNKEGSISNIEKNSSLSATALNTVSEDLKSWSKISTSSSKIESVAITEEAASLLVETNATPLIDEDSTQIDVETIIEECKSSSYMDNDKVLKTEPEDVSNSGDEDISSVVQNDDTISKDSEIIEACEACLNIESAVSCNMEGALNNADQASRQGDVETESSILCPDKEIQPPSDETILKEIKVIEAKKSTLETTEIPKEKSSENNFASAYEDSLNLKLEESSLVPHEQELRGNEPAATSEIQKTLQLEENLKNADNTLKEEPIANELENSAVKLFNIIEAETNPKIEAPKDERYNTDSLKINECEEKVEIQEQQDDKLLRIETPEASVKSSLTGEQESNSSSLAELSDEVSITVQELELNEPSKKEEEVVSQALSEASVKESTLLEPTETISITSCENVGIQSLSEEQKSEIIEETTEIVKQSAATATNSENVGTQPRIEEQKSKAIGESTETIEEPTETIEEPTETIEEPTETIEEPGTTTINFENIGTQPQSEEQKSEIIEEPTEIIKATTIANSENVSTQPQSEEQKSDTIAETTEIITNSVETNEEPKGMIEAVKEEIEDAKEIYVDAEETFDDAKEIIEETKETFEDAKETVEETAETFEDAKETIEEQEETIKESIKEHLIIQGDPLTKNDDTNLEEKSISLETNATDLCSTVEESSLTSSLSPTVENNNPAQIINVPTVTDDVKTLSSFQTGKAINAKQITPLAADVSNSSTVINDESVAVAVTKITKQITLEVENEAAKLEQTISKIECEISEPADALKLKDEDSEASSVSDMKDNEKSLVKSVAEGCEIGSQPKVIEKSLKEEINEVITLSASDSPHQTVKISNAITNTTTVITEIVQVPSKEENALLDDTQNYDAAKDLETQQKDSTDLNSSTNEEQSINDDSGKAVPQEAEIIVKENSAENLIKEATSEHSQIATTSIEDEAKENAGSVAKVTSSDTAINQTIPTTEYDVKSALIGSVQKENVPQKILHIEESPDRNVSKEEIQIEVIEEKKPDKSESDDSSAAKVENLDPVPEKLDTPEQQTNTKEEPSYINENTQSKFAPGENIETQHENISSVLENIEAKTEEGVLKADSLKIEQNTADIIPQNTASENQEEVQDVEQDAKVNLEEASKIAVDQVSSKQTDEENKSMPVTEVIDTATENIVTQQAEASTGKNINYADNIEEVESNEEKGDFKTEEAVVVTKSEHETEETSDRTNEIEKYKAMQQDPDNITTKLEGKTENESTEEGKTETTCNLKLEENSVNPIQTTESEMPEKISSIKLVIEELPPTTENIETATPLKEYTDESNKEEEISEHIQSEAETIERNNFIEKNNEESTIFTDVAAIRKNISVDSCEEAIAKTAEAFEKEEIILEHHLEAIHFTGTSESIIKESDITSAPKEKSTDPIEEAIIKENLSEVKAKIFEETVMIETHVSQSQPTNASEAAIQHEIEVEVSAAIDTSNSSETSFNAQDVVDAKSESLDKNEETTEITSDSNSKSIEEPFTNVNLTTIVAEKLEQLSADTLEDSKENKNGTVNESNITIVTEDNEASSNEVILEQSSAEEANSTLEKNNDEAAEIISNLELKTPSSKEEISLFNDTLARGANAEFNESLKQEIVKPITIEQTGEEKLEQDCIKTASEALDLIKVSIQNSNEITSEEMNLIHQENTILLTSTEKPDGNNEPLTDSSIHIGVSINSSDTKNLVQKEQEIVSVYVEYEESSITSENIPIQEMNPSLTLPTLTEEIEPPEEIENAETSFQITLNSDTNVTTIDNTGSSEISLSSNKTPSEIFSEIPKLTSPELLGKNNKIENNTSSEKQNKENVTNEKCPSSTLQFSVSTVSLKSPVISTDIVSSDSNTTDESVLTVIDARGLQQTVDEPNETAEVIVNITNDTTNNAASNNTLTTTTNNTNTSLDFTLSTNSVDTNKSNETGLEKSSEPESTENTSISKPLSEEHDVADPLKHLVPGSIAEREYKKWYNAVEMPNNPYTPEAIQRRLSLTEKSIDIPNIKPVMERMATVELVLSCDDNTEDIATNLEAKSDYTRYSRDYYINDAKHASGMVKSKTKSTSQSLLNTDDEQGISKQEPLSEGIATICVLKSQSATDKQSDNADIFLARPIRVEENDPPLDKATKFEQLNTTERGFILLPSGEVDSSRNTSTPVSEQGSSLTAESLTTSEDSDTIRIYDLNNQETRLVKDETNAVKSPPNTPNRPTVLSFMPKTSPPTKVLTPTRIVTPTSLRFLQPKRKIFDPKQIMTESFEKSSPILDGVDHEEPATNGIADKPVIEKEVASSLPSVRALAQAFLLASSKRNSNPLNRPKSPSLQSLEVKIDTEPNNECNTEDGPSADSYTPPYNQTFNPVTAPSEDEATVTENVIEETKIVYSVETPAAERPISPVLTPGQLRNSIAFFENLKKQ